MEEKIKRDAKTKAWSLDSVLRRDRKRRTEARRRGEDKAPPCRGYPELSCRGEARCDLSLVTSG